MPLRKFALFGRDKECTHGLGFPYSGKMPCTGEKRCPLCGMIEKDVSGIQNSVKYQKVSETKLIN